MIDVPTLAWSVSVVELAMAVVMFAVGTATHEGMHIGVFEALREPYSVDVLPNGLRGLLVGTAVSVQFESTPARWRVVAVALAPIVMAIPPLVAYAYALSFPVLDVGTALVLAAWFVAAIPSLHDFVTVLSYRPDRGIPTEVSS